MSAERAEFTEESKAIHAACIQMLADAQRYEQDLKRSLAEQSRGRIEAEQRAAALEAALTTAIDMLEEDWPSGHSEVEALRAALPRPAPRGESEKCKCGRYDLTDMIARYDVGGVHHRKECPA